MSDLRIGERRQSTQEWLDGIDKRHNVGRRISDARRIWPDPVASVLVSLATDPNIDPRLAAALAPPSRDPAWLEYRREEERAFPERDGSDE